MAKTITLILDVADIFQILDALNDRADSWERTAKMLNGEFESEDFFVPEECHEASEAIEIAQHFKDISSNIEAQIKDLKS